MVIIFKINRNIFLQFLEPTGTYGDVQSNPSFGYQIGLPINLDRNSSAYGEPFPKVRRNSNSNMRDSLL